MSGLWWFVIGFLVGGGLVSFIFWWVLGEYVFCPDDWYEDEA